MNPELEEIEIETDSVLLEKVKRIAAQLHLSPEEYISRIITRYIEAHIHPPENPQ